MNRISEEQVSRLLRRVAERIEPLQDEASLVERALEDAVDSFFRVGSPIGPVYIAVGSNGIRHLAPAGSPEKFVRGCRERFGRLVSPASEDLVTALAGRVEAALAGEWVEMPLDLSGTTPFQRRVLEAVKDIPRGEVRPRGRGTGRFQSRWQRDGEQPYTAPRAVPPRCPQRQPYGELRFRHGREGEAAARGGRLARGTRQSSLRSDANNRGSVPRYLS